MYNSFVSIAEGTVVQCSKNGAGVFSFSLCLFVCDYKHAIY